VFCNQISLNKTAPIGVRQPLETCAKEIYVKILLSPQRWQYLKSLSV